MDILAYIISGLVFGIIGCAVILSADTLYEIRDSIHKIEEILSEDKQHG